MSNEAMVFDTPQAISYVQLASVKARFKLLKAGLTFRGPSLRKLWAKPLGLKPRDSYDKFIETIQAKMDAILEEERGRSEGA